MFFKGGGCWPHNQSLSDVWEQNGSKMKGRLDWRRKKLFERGSSAPVVILTSQNPPPFFDTNTNTSCPHVRDSRIHKHPHHTCQLSGGGGNKGGGGHRVLHVPVLLAGCPSAGNKGDCLRCLCAQLCQFFFFFLALPSLRSDECLALGTWHQVPQWAWTSGNRNSNSRM